MTPSRPPRARAGAMSGPGKWVGPLGPSRCFCCERCRLSTLCREFSDAVEHGCAHNVPPRPFFAAAMADRALVAMLGEAVRAAFRRRAP